MSKKNIIGSGRVRLTENDNLFLPRSIAVPYAYAVGGQTRSAILHHDWNFVLLYWKSVLLFTIFKILGKVHKLF